MFKPKKIELIEHEKLQVRGTVNWCREFYGTIDNEDFVINTNRLAMKLLPERLLDGITDFVHRQAFNDFGALIIEDLIDVDQQVLGSTPDSWQKAYRSYFTDYEFLSALLMGALRANMVRFKIQRGGKDLCQPIIPDLSLQAGEQVGAEPGRVILALHNEDQPLLKPADWLSFLFLRNFEEAPSQLGSIRSVDLQKLVYRDLLFEPVFPAVLDDNYANSDIPLVGNETVPILYGNTANPFIRFDPVAQLPYATGETYEAMIELDALLKANVVQYVPKPGTAILLNNRRVLHGRGKFNAGYSKTGQSVERRIMLRTMGWAHPFANLAFTDTSDPYRSVELRQGELFA